MADGRRRAAGIAPAGYVAVWIANPGVLDRPAPEYPLLHDGTADVFRGVPAGESPRGNLLIDIPVVGNNFVVGGIMGQGKSNALPGHHARRGTGPAGRAVGARLRL